MPNIMVTNVCNLACDYCFGHEQMYPRIKKEFMSKKMYTDILHWLKDSGIKYFHLMGGEPTMHPDFIWMLQFAVEMGFVVDVFSNGITNFTISEMKTAKKYSNHWIINVNDPKGYNISVQKRIEKLLRVLGKKAALTFNIINTDYDPKFLIKYINDYKLLRTVKIGIALPTLNRANVYAKPENFNSISNSMLKVFKIFQSKNIDSEFECGVPHCFFSEAKKKELDKTNFKGFSQCCSILDILPNGDTIYCLPLAKMLKVNYKKYLTYQALSNYFQDYYKPYRSIGYKKRCLTCKLKINCQGSCLARIIGSFMHSAKTSEGSEAGLKTQSLVHV